MQRQRCSPSMTTPCNGGDGPFENYVSPFAPQKWRYFRGAKGDYLLVIS